MTYEQYWYGDVWMVEAYRKAEKLRLSVVNQKLWLQGQYVYEAICDVSPILHAFAKRGTKPIPYRSEPYQLLSSTPKEDNKNAENERLKAQLFFKNWARATKKHFE